MLHNYVSLYSKRFSEYEALSATYTYAYTYLGHACSKQSNYDTEVLSIWDYIMFD